MSKNTIKPSEHVGVYGMTGGGKSYLVRNYLAVMPPVIKLDTKGEAIVDLQKGRSPWEEVDPGQIAVVLSFEGLKEVDFVKRPYVIYCPDGDIDNDETMETDDPDHFNDVFKWIYKTFTKRPGGVRVWIDELKDVNESPHSIHKYLKFLYTKGRFFDCSVWACSQEPRHNHSLTLSQNTHYFVFDLARVEDRKRLADNTGAPEMLKLPGGYSFWYFKRGWRLARKGIMEG